MNSDQFKLTIRTSNAAFGGGAGEIDEYAAGVEIARILRKVADYIEEYGVPRTTHSIFDQNGNRVGGYKLEDD
ncbi:hypothetical protein BH762_gp027 [Gordonia phage OneUp]|uniref:Uncharacterized protein n=1 Tax=Gordonia phage OneUp TaxID=1838074 RepID=A0A160DF31_9CAUD|nr:hypothetical protein BH762_gp027 [Gordonia phage OneUp]ANA86491.1 hypothetical protein PBI_ONEUP_158 [Gordonia phage OneUp]